MYLFLFNETMLEEIIIAVMGGIILAVIIGVYNHIKKVFHKQTIPKTENKAFYLNQIQNSLTDLCIGREALLQMVFKRIKGKKPTLFIGNHIGITGIEGIGKTLFCQILYNKYLLYSEVYLGWIDCNGYKSIFDIMSGWDYFKKNKKKEILYKLKNLGKPCILFIDQIENKVSNNELNELAICSNITLIVCGDLSEIKFINNPIILPPLEAHDVKKIFEEKSGVIIDLLEDYKERASIHFILKTYGYGNPFLVSTFARAKLYNCNTWLEIKMQLDNMTGHDKINDRFSKSSLNNSSFSHYIRNVFKQLFRVYDLNKDEKEILSNLALFSHRKHTQMFFDLLECPKDCIESLCDKNWLKHNTILYELDDVYFQMIKILFNDNLNSFNQFMVKFNSYCERKMSVILYPLLDYIDDIEINIKMLMHENEGNYACYNEFIYNIALIFYGSGKDLDCIQKCIEWLELCSPTTNIIEVNKAVLDFKCKIELFNLEKISSDDVEKTYLHALDSCKMIANADEYKIYIDAQYLLYKYKKEEFDYILSYCENYFNIHDYRFDSFFVCNLFEKYVGIVFQHGSVENIKKLLPLAKEETILSLVENKNVAPHTIPFILKHLRNLFEILGNHELGERCFMYTIILLNEEEFYGKRLKSFSENLTDEIYINFMHSKDEYLQSLNDALERNDINALCLEAKYKEKHNNFDEAYSLYERASRNGSLMGMHSLGILCYKGQGDVQDLDKAYQYWEYCCGRNYIESYYWLGVLLNDENYHGYNKELAIEYLTKSANMGNNEAKQLLQSFSKEYI